MDGPTAAVDNQQQPVGLVVAADDRAGDAVKVLLSHAGHSPSTVVHLLHHLQHRKVGMYQRRRAMTDIGGRGGGGGSHFVFRDIKAGQISEYGLVRPFKSDIQQYQRK